MSTVLVENLVQDKPFVSEFHLYLHGGGPVFNIQS